MRVNITLIIEKTIHLPILIIILKKKNKNIMLFIVVVQHLIYLSVIVCTYLFVTNLL